MEAKFICLEEPAFYELIEKIVDRLKGQNNIHEEAWLSTDEAMKKLKFGSKTTLAKVRDEGNLKFVYATPRVILYETASINQYLEKNAQKTFS